MQKIKIYMINVWLYTKVKIIVQAQIAAGYLQRKCKQWPGFKQ